MKKTDIYDSYRKGVFYRDQALYPCDHVGERLPRSRRALIPAGEQFVIFRTLSRDRLIIRRPKKEGYFCVHRRDVREIGPRGETVWQATPRVVIADFSGMSEELRQKYEGQFPFKQGEGLLLLGEIANMPGHVAVANREGKVLWGYHDENFREPTEDEL